MLAMVTASKTSGAEEVAISGLDNVTSASSGRRRRKWDAERAALWLLVALYLICAVGFAAVTPYGEAPDEPNHLRYIEYLERFHAMPEIALGNYTGEAFQPPLYYMLGASIVVVARKATGYPSREAQLTPPLRQRSNDIEVSGKLAFFEHPPGERWLFWPYVLRAPSILMGLGVVLLTYATARALVPRPASSTVPLVATAFAALIPQANSIRASISNENLAELVGAWIMWMLVLHLNKPASKRRIVWLGIALGLAFITKISVTLLLLPVLWVLWVRRESIRAMLKNWAILAACILVLSSWFYLYRLIVYGDPLATDAWHALMPPDGVYHLTDLFWFKEPFRYVLWDTFWGFYGFQRIAMPFEIYNGFTIVTLLGIAGGVYLLVRRALSRAQQESCAALVGAILLMYILVIQGSTYLIAWQGREMYPALSSICVLFGLGLGGLALGRAAVHPTALPKPQWKSFAGPGLVAIVTIGLLSVNIYSIFWLVLPGLN